MEENQVVVEETQELKQTKVAGIVALATGIASWVLPYFGLACIIVALIFGKKSVGTTGEKMGKIGKTLAKVNLIISIVIFALSMLFTIGCVVLALLSPAFLEGLMSTM